MKKKDQVVVEFKFEERRDRDQGSNSLSWVQGEERGGWTEEQSSSKRKKKGMEQGVIELEL
jgi:hypothetical protein